MLNLLARHRTIAQWFTARLNIASERGATSLEYAIIASAIAAVVVLAVAFLGGATTENFECTGESWSTQSAQC